MNVANVGEKSDGRELMRRDEGPGSGSGNGSGRGASPEASKTSFGIYKFGQGYWVRMLTAIAVAAIFLAGAAWLYSELGAIRPAPSGFALTVRDVEGTVQNGQVVDLATVIDGNATKIGTATVTTVALAGGESGTISVGLPQMGTTPVTAGAAPDLSGVGRIDVVGEAGQSIFRAAVLRAEPIASFDKTYIQLGVAAAVLLTGLVLVYLYVGAKPKPVDFLIATDGEMKKVNWGTRKLIIDSTRVVIAATFLIAAFIFVADTILSQGMQFVGVLQR
jgi:preprotein translocase SecE subunit